jgi:type I restriction enzyme M protein
MLTGDKRTQIDKIWNAFWTGGVSNPLTVIEQITYLLFIKRLDELQDGKEAKAQGLNLPIESPIFTEVQKEIRWQNFKDLDAEALYKLFTKENGVFDFMKHGARKLIQSLHERSHFYDSHAPLAHPSG